MAQRPRQTRLQFESQFRPTSIDTMAADAMRQLAGLGRQMRQTTEEIGRPIVEQKAAERGREEAKQALEEGREVEKISLLHGALTSIQPLFLAPIRLVQCVTLMML